MRQAARRGVTGPFILAALMIGGCSGQGAEQEDAEPGAPTADFVANTTGTRDPAAAPVKAVSVSEKTDLLEFSFGYPAPAAGIPAIARRLDADMRRSKDDALAMAREDKAAADQSGFPFHTHSLETTWSVAADTPRLLSLRSETYVFTGGAHGMTGYGALLWDKARQREASLSAMMVAPSAFAAATRDRFCTDLDAERAKKRGAPVKRGNDEFTKCIDPMKEVLVPASTDGRRIDRITVVIAPYSAGPYAEGSYEVELPVDAAMLKAIRPEFHAAFAGGN
ncbi:MAG: DUF4163 domain-containing protein [Sphingobium sp.]